MKIVSWNGQSIRDGGASRPTLIVRERRKPAAAAAFLLNGDGKSGASDSGWLVFTTIPSITLWTELGGCEPLC